MATVAAPARALTERSATDLARAIRSREVTSRDVVEAHLELIARREPDVNAIVADRFEAARADADAADARVAAAADPDELPPLLGVPCTIKESIQLEGMPNAAGVTTRRDIRSTSTAPTAERLIGTGAIPLAVTNTSELTLWVEAENRLYGRTNNAYDRTRTAGGSSGGEGASVGSGYAPVGLGSDIGGSIRLPAFFNGVFGHKCSSGLVPLSGQWPPAEGDAGRMLAVGPIARRAEDLFPVLSAIAGPDGVDPIAHEVDLGDPADVDISELDVIVTRDGSTFPVARELLDARERAAGALAAAGASVRDESLRSIRRAMDYYLATLQAGSPGNDLSEMLGLDGPLKLRHALADALRGRGNHTVPTVLTLMSERASRRLPQGRTEKSVAAGKALAREVEAVLGDGILLHPPFPRVAPKHNRTVGRPWMLLPVAVFNMLGLPATAVPLGLNGQGLPLGVQVVGPRDRDQIPIAVALELERVFGGWVPPESR
jgi:fatty acid amide hydrolase 2